MRCLTAGVVAVVLAAGAPGAVLAHAQEGTAQGLADGLVHPLLGPDHLVAMVAVGLWGAQLGAPLLLALPVAFPLMMTVGALWGLSGAPLPGAEVGVGLSALALGLFVLRGWRAPVWAAVPLVALFGVLHGYAHGRELPEAVNPLAYGVGFVVATGLLHAVGIVIGELAKTTARGRGALQACGGGGGRRAVRRGGRGGRAVSVRALALAAAAALAADPAAAHLVGVRFGDFYAGALHVATAVEHVAAVLALALLAALQPRSAGRWALLAGPAGLLLGALTATLGQAERAIDAAVVGAFALAGALAALGLRLPPAVVLGVAFGVGLTHGYANGLAAAGARIDPWLYSAGVAAAGLVAISLGAAAGRALTDAAPRVAIVWRVVGSWIAAAGLVAFGLSVARAMTAA
jgi:urease accessory protein